MASTTRQQTIATTPGDEAEARAVGLDRAPRTELGQLIVAARRAFLDSHGRFLTREELEREIAERRGGVVANDEA